MAGMEDGDRQAICGSPGQNNEFALERGGFRRLYIFGACWALFVLLIAFAGQHSQTIDFETMLALPILIAPAGAVVVGALRFFWLRRSISDRP
jgi:predicted metal-binding membrane protein